MLKDKLRETRLLCGFSQKQVADVLKIHRSTYSYYELGTTEPSLENICTLAKLFNVSIYELLEIEPTGELSVADPGYDDGFEYLNADGVQRTGDLTRDEKKLILLFRLMTASQRKELLEVMCDPGGDGDEEK